MAKEWQTINIEKANVENLIICSKYFKCSYSEMLGLLLRLANMHDNKTIIAGEPAATAFNRHVSIQVNNELRAKLEK